MRDVEEMRRGEGGQTMVEGREGKGRGLLDVIEPDDVVLSFHEHACRISRGNTN